MGDADGKARLAGSAHPAQGGEGCPAGVLAETAGQVSNQLLAADEIGRDGRQLEKT